jgi:hypothetical protein
MGSVVFAKRDLWMGNRERTLKHRRSPQPVIQANKAHHVCFGPIVQAGPRMICNKAAEKGGIHAACDAAS